MLHRIAQTHPVQVATPTQGRPKVEQVVPKTPSQLKAIQNGYMPSNPPRPQAPAKDTTVVTGGIIRKDF